LIDRKNVYWKNRIERKECLKIQLNKNSEFYAKDVVFEGDFSIEVPRNTKMVAYMDQEKSGIQVY